MGNQKKNTDIDARSRQEVHERDGHRCVYCGREGIVREFLERKVPDDWAKWPLDKRRLFWGGNSQEGYTLVERDRVCAVEIWVEAFGGQIKEMRNTDTRELNAIISALPEWHKSANVSRFGPYGPQRGFTK